MEKESTLHYRGRYLNLIERDGWEFATRTNPVVAVLVAWTDADELLLVEQFRKPVDNRVIELPAGLVGDIEDQAGESVLDAAARELVEETGYQAARLHEIMRCPTSAGMTDETAVFIAAQGLTRVGPGGGDDSEDIVVHVIAAQSIDAWLDEQYRSGKAIDPKIYSALYWGLKKGSGRK
ncbi:MAG: NUDIX hydrolase [Wenzhouxiangellaceae bacterium]|nr:NUDIX hydrolase [Wenzhouxiangellaceae bacterium]